MKVDFMIIGAQKCGTTSLAHYLSKHPKVCFCLEKEPDFFNRHEDWRARLENYHKLFRPTPGQILGEASTSYTMIPDFTGTEEKILEYNPNMKLIYLVRDPIERIKSHYAHRLIRQNTLNDLHEEVLNNPIYIDRSKYFFQLKPYYDLFGNDQILLLLFEDLIKSPKECLIKVAAFLNIDEQYFHEGHDFSQKNKSTDRNVLPETGWTKIFRPLKSIRRLIPEFLIRNLLRVLGNKLQEKPEFPFSLQQQLYASIAEDVRQFEALYGREIREWKKY